MDTTVSLSSSLTSKMAQVTFAPLLPSSLSSTTMSTTSTSTTTNSSTTVFGQDNNRSRTVILNVGGYHYEVSRSLIQQYPNTMLSRAISDVWNPPKNNTTTNNTHPLILTPGIPNFFLRLKIDHEPRRNSHFVKQFTSRDFMDANNDRTSNDNTNSTTSPKKNSNNNTIFIDRDGKRFAYVLDYMRDGGYIELPYNAPITKETFIAELLYYGFDITDATRLFITIGPLPISKVYACVNDTYKLYKEKLANYDEQIQQIQDEKLYTYVSYKCFNAVLQNRTYTFQLSKIISRKDSYIQFVSYLSGKYNKSNGSNPTITTTTSTGSIASDRAVSEKDRKKKKQEQKALYEYHKELFNTSLQEYGLQFIKFDPTNPDIIHLSSLE